MKGLVVVLAVLACAWPAAAGAPRPAKAVGAGLFSGRWYEIARTPNLNQIDCEGATSDFAHWSGVAFAVTQTCHRGTAAGPARTFKADGRVLPGSGNARMKLAFFGGMLSQEYWILDHADDDGWAIMATPGGHYVWLLARRPALDPATRARALGRVAALGYDLKTLAFPQQAAR